jgi:hypothetical protein
VENGFSSYKQVIFFKTDGLTIPSDVGDFITFVFSFHSMVQFDRYIVKSYMLEIYKIMKHGAYAFLHHSHTPECPLTLSTGFCVDSERQDRDLYNPHHRAANSKQHIAIDAILIGFENESQHDVIWDMKLGVTDAITILRKIK